MSTKDRLMSLALGMVDAAIAFGPISEQAKEATREFEAAIAALQKDAMRYRWLRRRSGTLRVGDPGKSGYHFQMLGEFDPMSGVLDSLFDAAMAPTQPGSKEPHATQAESRPDGQDQYLPGSQASSQTLGPDQT